MSARLMIQAARVCPTISGLPDQPAVGARRPWLIGCAEGNKPGMEGNALEDFQKGSPCRQSGQLTVIVDEKPSRRPLTYRLTAALKTLDRLRTRAR
jgi:hypothetical protein